MRTVGFLDPRQGTPCDQALQTAMFNARPSACSLATGYSFWVIQAPPTAAQIPAICGSSACKQVIDAARKVAPTECVMFDGFFLYQDILNPIIAQCGNAAAPAPTPAPAPATTTPAPGGGSAPSTAAPAFTGERPVEVTWVVPTSTPSLRLTAAPSAGDFAKSTSSSDSDSGTPFGLIFGLGAGAIVLIALILCCRQRRKRDPDVQRQ